MEKLAFKIGEEFWLKPNANAGITGTLAYQSLGGFISAVLPNIYVFAGIILFFLLIGGGLMFIVSSGQENPEGAAKGKQAITAALIGFLIIFASYWIIQIIEIITGINIFQPGL